MMSSLLGVRFWSRKRTWFHGVKFMNIQIDSCFLFFLFSYNIGNDCRPVLTASGFSSLYIFSFRFLSIFYV
ncbi:hypothetical protein L1987_01459 [Smallanthus sonchifolius]|uniref:Uncharacterized protein n=1 Tax=Smallanthus sonchifolius TaxID=185202 RepID=A0ACB9K4X8_9ASTR|nr:hypothetical protein L1987_01459 [Smallanthus sonchifolius]